MGYLRRETQIANWPLRPSASIALRYGLAFVTLAAALGLAQGFLHFHLPQPFTVFALLMSQGTRARNELEVRVAERTADLTRANEELMLEIAERKHAEKELRESINEQK